MNKISNWLYWRMMTKVFTVRPIEDHKLTNWGEEGYCCECDIGDENYWGTGPTPHEAYEDMKIILLEMWDIWSTFETGNWWSKKEVAKKFLDLNEYVSYDINNKVDPHYRRYWKTQGIINKAIRLVHNIK